MATSGSYNYNVTTSEIVTTAHQIIQQYGANETVSSADSNYATTILNQLGKFLPSYAGFLWKRQIGYVFLDSSKVSYNLGNLSTDDHATDSYVTTTLTAAVAASATTITVDDITGFSNTANIGIMKDDASIYWTTISGTPSGSTITLANGPTSAITSGNRVWSYSTKIARPLKIMRAFRREYNGTDYSDIVIRKAALLDYVRLPQKAEGNSVLQFVYSKKLTSGLMYTWPVENSGHAILGILYDQNVEDFDSSTDNPDFPQQWLLPLSYQLAYYIAPAYGITGELRNEIRNDATELLNIVLSYDADDENTKIEIDTMGNGGT